MAEAGGGRHGAAFWEQEKNNFGFKMLNKMGWAQGQGLGKKQRGTTSFLRAFKKRDNAGLGARAGTDDLYSATQGLFNDVLKRLNEAQKQVKEQVKEKEEEEKEEEQCKEPSHISASTLETYLARRRLYGKFRRATDVSNYSSEALHEIFGRKPNLSSTHSIC